MGPVANAQVANVCPAHALPGTRSTRIAPRASTPRLTRAIGKLDPVYRTLSLRLWLTFSLTAAASILPARRLGQMAQGRSAKAADACPARATQGSRSIRVALPASTRRPTRAIGKPKLIRSSMLVRLADFLTLSGGLNASCKTTWANGSGAQCQGGKCVPGSCAAGYTLNPSGASCVNTQNDNANWFVAHSLVFRNAHIFH